VNSIKFEITKDQVRLMGNDSKSCYAADALRRIRQTPINGIPTGICMLDECIADVNAQDLKTEPEIRAAHLKRVNVYNYLSRTIEDEYARVLLE
jgi:hypothetical protein